MAGRDDLIDESRPVVRPLLLQDGNQDEVKLVEEGFLRSQRLFAVGALDDELNNEVSNACFTIGIRVS